MKRLIIIAVIGYFAWHGYAKNQSMVDADEEAVDGAEAAVAISHRFSQSSPASAVRFSCDGRTYCSQMTSCAEATYFLKNCPGTKMDGNRDGVPCEQQWCG
ncbi:hypothetical protein GCM10023089_29360 [Quisquiliibacterium transsilvanicum]